MTKEKRDIQPLIDKGEKMEETKMEERLTKLTAIIEDLFITSSQKDECLGLIDDIAEELL